MRGSHANPFILTAEISVTHSVIRKLDSSIVTLSVWYSQTGASCERAAICCDLLAKVSSVFGRSIEKFLGFGALFLRPTRIPGLSTKSAAASATPYG